MVLYRRSGRRGRGMRGRNDWRQVLLTIFPAGLRRDEALSLSLLAGLLLVLCIAGGASRVGELGQVIVRCAALAILLTLCAVRSTWSIRRVREPLAMITAMAVIGICQLIPLPPGLWTSLPGREPFAGIMANNSQPWRPINLTPDGGLNAILALVVPLAAVAILAGIPRRHRGLVADMLLAVLALAALLGSLQISGGAYNNPLINETVGEAAGIFANRNHQALALACGLPMICSWALRGKDGGRVISGRLAMAGGLAMWFLFLILATGSRAGVVLGAFGLLASAGLVWQRLRQTRQRWPGWVMPTLAATLIVTIVAIITIGIASGQALSLQRFAASNGNTDIRISSLPILWKLVVHYFPLGSGLGSFDPMFRIVEPFELLAPTYFNHAHNDALELLIEAGFAGAVLIVIGLFLWGRLGFRAWRDGVAYDSVSPAAWSALTLILLASLVDYPLRTPTIMTLAVIAAWLARPHVAMEGDAALP